MKIRLGEPTFVSIQGEGLRTGVLSVWHRFFGCSLRCPGFFQPDPTDVSTYIDPLKGINPKEYKSVFELPVVEYGCDSIYSIDPRFKHCAYDYTLESLLEETYKALPTGKFKHKATGQTYDWCLTGGEPLMNQDKIIKLYAAMYERDNFPYDVQIETNCTRALEPQMVEMIDETMTKNRLNGNTNWYFSMSPKLFHVAGEPDDKAWHPDIIKQYWDTCPYGWLKVVVNNTDACWEEFESKMDQLREMGVHYPVMVMPVGATKEQQEDSAIVAQIANKAIAKGYHVSGRLHCTIWGNTAGV